MAEDDDVEYDMELLDTSVVSLDPKIRREMQRRAEEAEKAKKAAEIVLEPEPVTASTEETAVAAAAEAEIEAVAEVVEQKEVAAAREPQKTPTDWIIRCMEDAEIATEPIRGAGAPETFTDNQRVFFVDSAKPEEVSELNGGQLWYKTISYMNNEKENDESQYRSYWLPWPDRLNYFKEKVVEFTSVFTASEQRLADTLRPNEFDASGNSRGLVMTIPFAELRKHVPGMSDAKQGHGFHLVPISAELLDHSTEQLPFASCISLCSFTHNRKAGGTMLMERYNADSAKMLTASGETHGLTVVPKEHGSRTTDVGPAASSKKAKRGILCAANTDLLFSPWVSRLGFLDLSAFLTDVMKMSHPDVRDILLIKAPTPENKRVTLANWFVLTFFPFFQVSMNRWYERASPENKRLLGDVSTDLTEEDPRTTTTQAGRRVLHAVHTSGGKVKLALKVPVAAFVELVAYLMKRFHPVRWAMRFTRGLNIKFENQNTRQQNAALLAPIERAEAAVRRRREYLTFLKGVDTGGLEFKKEMHRATCELEDAERHLDCVNPLLTEEYAKVRFAALVVAEVLDHNSERLSRMARPSSDFATEVDGRSCLCHQKEEGGKKKS